MIINIIVITSCILSDLCFILINFVRREELCHFIRLNHFCVVDKCVCTLVTGEIYVLVTFDILI